MTTTVVSIWATNVGGKGNARKKTESLTAVFGEVRIIAVSACRQVTLLAGSALVLVFFVQPLCSLCLCGLLCAKTTTETQRTQRRIRHHYLREKWECKMAAGATVY